MRMLLSILTLSLLVLQSASLECIAHTDCQTVGIPVKEGNPIDDLLREMLEKFRTNMPMGFPDLGIPPLDPYHINLTIAIDQSGLNMFANVTNGDVVELSTFVINQLHVNLLTLKATLALGLPELRLAAQYFLDGLIGGLFPLYGGGACSVVLSNLTFSVDADLNLNRSDNHEHLQISTMDFNLHVLGMDIQIHNLFNSEALASVFDGFAEDVGPLLVDVFVNDTRRDLLPQIIDKLNDLLWNVTLPIAQSRHSETMQQRGKLLLPGVSTSANADDLFDHIIPYLQKFVVANNLDPLPLPEYDELIGDDTGVKLYDGSLSGISTLHRRGEAIMAYYEEWLSVSSEIDFSQLTGGYKLKIEILGIGPHVTASIKLSDTKARFNVKISSKTLEIVLDELEITDIGSVDVTIRGLGIYQFLLEPLIDLLVTMFKGQIADAISGALFNTVADALSNIDLLSILKNL